MKIEFSQPRFTGARFDEHTLPLDVVGDLAAYQALIIDLAKHLYFKNNPDRMRLPKGFESNFRLDIERIDPGSAKLGLVRVLPFVALTLFGGGPDCFEQARDLIADCIAAPKHSLPDGFPKELLSYFNKLGQSLRDGEALELPLRDDRQVARLTPERRKQLVLTVNQVYESEVTLVGLIEEVDFAKSTFRLKLADGGPVVLPMLESFKEVVRAFAGRSHHQVKVGCVGTFDSSDRLQKVIAVSGLEVVENYAISARIDDIAQLENGWFEGSGVAFDKEKLSVVAEKLIAAYPNELPLPQIVPKQDGNLLLEWSADGDPSLDIDLASLQAYFHAFDTNGADVERDFHLNADGWKALFSFLGDNIKASQA